MRSDIGPAATRVVAGICGLVLLALGLRLAYVDVVPECGVIFGIFATLSLMYAIYPWR